MKLIVYFLSVLYITWKFSWGASLNDDRYTSGYVEVRPGVHKFWLLYYTRRGDDYRDSPLVLYLEGGAGDSATGTTNFFEIGPLDEYLKPRKYSWTNYTNVLFVDSPVGSGWSYVEDPSLLARNNTQVSKDLFKFMYSFLKTNPEFQTVPLYIFGHSQGGKNAAQFAFLLEKQIRKGRIKCNLQGVALGDAWISPIDSIRGWASYLYATSLVDAEERDQIQNAAEKVKVAIDSSQRLESFFLWDDTRNLIFNLTNNVLFNNILKQNTKISPESTFAKQQFSKKEINLFGQRPLAVGVRYNAELHNNYMLKFMNGKVRKMLGNIPPSVKWGSQSALVFAAVAEDRNTPTVRFVEEILENSNVNVTVYNGQLDLTVSTNGALDWVQNLKWSGIDKWKNADRQPIVFNSKTRAFVKSYGQLSFYWMLRSGHRLQVDTPAVGVDLLQRITQLKT